MQNSTLPSDHVFTLQQSGKSLREALFKLFGRLPSDAISWLQHHQPVLIHAHFASDGVLSLPLARRLRIPLVVSLLGSDITMKENHVLRSSYPTHRLYLFRKKRLFRYAYRFIVPSRFLWNVALERGYPEDKLLLLPHGVDTRFFSPDPEAVVPGRILFVGRFVALKGPHLLLEAARRLMAEFTNLHVVMVGDGPERSRLEAWAGKHCPNRVHFLGMQPPEVVRREMQKAWVFSMPSIPVATGQAESFGMVFGETPACGTPFVSFKTGGIQEVVCHGERGIVVSPDDVGQLTQAPREPFSRPDFRHRMTFAIRHWAVSHFDIPKQAKILGNLYEDTLSIPSTTSRKLILNVITQMDPKGAQNSAVEVTRQLREMGYNAEAWSLFTKHPAFKGCSVRSIVFPWRSSHPGEILALLWQVFRALRKETPVGIITCTSYANLLVQPLALLARMIQHRMVPQRNSSTLPPRIADFLDILWGTVGVYTFNVFVSHAVKESYHSAPRPYLKRSVVVYNGIEFTPLGLSKGEARPKLGLPLDAWIAGHVGQMDRKNQQVLIQALSRLNIPEAVLALVGKGVEENSLPSLTHALGLDSRVDFFGTLPREEIAAFYTAIDVFILPSLSEGFPFVLVGAMRSRCPVGVSDPAVTHAIAGDTVQYFSPVNTDDIVSVLSRFDQNPKSMIALGKMEQNRSLLSSFHQMIQQYLSELLRQEP